MNKKTMNMDDIIRFSEAYENDEFYSGDVLENEVIDDNFSENRGNNLNQKDLYDDLYYTNDCDDCQDEEDLLLNLINEEDDNFGCYEENHHIYCQDEDAECSGDKQYYTECNENLGFSTEDTAGLEIDCGCEEDEEPTLEEKLQEAYDDGYDAGFIAGYEKAKQEVIDYIKKRKKRKNKKCNCCCRCC